MVSFHLVRHGESEASSHGAALTAVGREQAVAVGRRLAGITFDAACRSDMARAVETAGILARGRADLDWLVSPALRELDFSAAPPLDAGAEGYRTWETQALVPMEAGLRGWLEGLVGASPDAVVADLATRRLKPAATGDGPHPPCGRPLPPGAATPGLPLPAGEGRGEGTPTRLSPDSRVLVVAHSGPIRLLICLLMGISVEHHWGFRVNHASLTVVERGADMGTLVLLNDRCHLAGIANPMEAHHGR